jgi:SNF2 family DNA or RNA helicase
VTNFALARQDRSLLEAVNWDLLVVDEAQNIKNPNAQQTRAIKSLTGRGRIALTGTPVENHLGDLWSLFDFAVPGLLGGRARFSRSFVAPIRAGRVEALGRMKKRIGPFLLRRTKRQPEIAAELPDKQEQVVSCGMTSEQVALYRAMAEAALTGLADKSGMARKAHVLQALLHLKQICNHPESFVSETPGNLIGRSGKLNRLCALLEELLASEQAVLVFTQFTRMGEFLQRTLMQRFELEAPFFHGGLNPSIRARMVDAFQNPDGPPVLLLSLRAGGSGLNLARASAVIHYDRWWNPAVEDQATDRAHRIGQTQKVNVYKLVTRGTIEERIDALIEEKKELARHVLAAGEERWLTEMSNDELRQFFTLGDRDEETNGEEMN